MCEQTCRGKEHQSMREHPDIVTNTDLGTRFPLREKRKARTRASLIKASRALFSRKGYGETTLQEVAEHAGLHVQTLYRHFQTKQDLATAGDQDLLDRFRALITDPARAGNTFEFWRAWVKQAAEAVVTDGGKRYRKYLRARAALPVVSIRLLSIGQAYEDLLTASLANDFRMTAERVSTPRLVAVMLWGGNSHVVRSYAGEHAGEDDFDLVSEAVGVVDSVEKMFGDLVVPDRNHSRDTA